MKKCIFGLICLLAILTACTPKKPSEPVSPPPLPSPDVVAPKPPEQPKPEQPVSNEPKPEQPVLKDPEAIQFFDCGTLDLSNTDSISGRENFEEFLNVTGTGTSATIQITKPDGSLTLSFDGSIYTLKAAKSETTWKQIQIIESSVSGKIYQAFRLTNEENLSTETPDGEQAVTLFKEVIES